MRIMLPFLLLALLIGSVAAGDGNVTGCQAKVAYESSNLKVQRYALYSFAAVLILVVFALLMNIPAQKLN